MKQLLLLYKREGPLFNLILTDQKQRALSLWSLNSPNSLSVTKESNWNWNTGNWGFVSLTFFFFLPISSNLSNFIAHSFKAFFFKAKEKLLYTLYKYIYTYLVKLRAKRVYFSTSKSNFFLCSETQRFVFVYIIYFINFFKKKFPAFEVSRRLWEFGTGFSLCGLLAALKVHIFRRSFWQG